MEKLQFYLKDKLHSEEYVQIGRMFQCENFVRKIQKPEISSGV
jgi:hypothetical protein